MRGVVDRIPDSIEVLEPAVGRRFVPNATPDSLLGIQRRLIRLQILQVQPPVRVEESSNLVPFVPRGSIDIQPHPIPLEPVVQGLQDHEESLPVASGRSDHPVTTQQGRHPSRDIEAFLMLAGGGDSKALPPRGPAPSQPRMEGKTRLILEGYPLCRRCRNPHNDPLDEDGVSRGIHGLDIRGIAGDIKVPLTISRVIHTRNEIIRG